MEAIVSDLSNNVMSNSDICLSDIKIFSSLPLSLSSALKGLVKSVQVYHNFNITKHIF